MSSPPALALLAALAFSLHNFLVRLGIEESSPATAVAVTVTTNAVGLWALAAWLSPVRPFFSWDVWPFILAGVCAPCLARSFLFRGYKHLGLARSDAIAGSEPLFAALLAVASIGERPSVQTLLGAACIVLGIGRLCDRPGETRPRSLWAIVFPLGAAFFFGLRDVIIKFGLQLIPVPLTGAAVAATVAGLILNFPYLFAKGRERLVLTPRSAVFFLLGGLSATAAYLSMFVALVGGMVSLVSPLVGVFPLFSVILSSLFLRSKERITWKVVSGGALVVAGTVLILSS